MSGNRLNLLCNIYVCVAQNNFQLFRCTFWLVVVSSPIEPALGTAQPQLVISDFIMNLCALGLAILALALG